MAKEKKTADEMLYSGAILKAYSTDYLVSICPAFTIDKVRVSVVKLNTSGKESSDIYLSCEEFRQFLCEVDRGITEKKCAEDTGMFPTAYEWKKGENGSKVLTIGGGNSGIRVQVGITDETGKKCYKTGIVKASDLKQASFLYKLVSGLIETTSGSYYAFLYDTYWTGVSERNEHFTSEHDSEPETSRLEQECYVNQNGLPEPKGHCDEEAVSAAKTQIQNSLYSVSVFAGEIPAEGYTSFRGRIAESDEDCIVFFKNRVFDDDSIFKKLRSTLKEANGVKVKLRGEMKDNNLYVSGFASGKEER